MESRKSEFPPGMPNASSAAATGSNSSDELDEKALRIGRIAYRRGRGEDVTDEGVITKEDEALIAKWRPARDHEAFRRWQDQHASPETVAQFEEARSTWHKRNQS